MATAPEAPGVGDLVTATIGGEDVDGVVVDPPEWEIHYAGRELYVPVKVDAANQYHVPAEQVRRR